MALSLLLRSEGWDFVTFGTEQLEALIKKFGIYAVHVDDEHELYVLCEHPVTKVLTWHTIPDLLATGEEEEDRPKLSVVKPN